MKNKGVIILALFALGVLAVVLLGRNNDSPSKKAAIGLPAPPFTLQDTSGKTWRLSDLKGKVVLLNFWASWCDPCKGELPSIQRLINAQFNNENFVFISVLYRDDPANALNLLKSKGANFPVLIDNQNIATAYGITGVPETFIITKKGIIKDKIVGPLEWDSPEALAAVKRLSEGNE